jgi:hypothetical protein
VLFFLALASCFSAAQCWNALGWVCNSVYKVSFVHPCCCIVEIRAWLFDMEELECCFVGCPKNREAGREAVKRMGGEQCIACSRLSLSLL